MFFQCENSNLDSEPSKHANRTACLLPMSWLAALSRLVSPQVAAVGRPRISAAFLRRHRPTASVSSAPLSSHLRPSHLQPYRPRCNSALRPRCRRPPPRTARTCWPSCRAPHGPRASAHRAVGRGPPRMGRGPPRAGPGRADLFLLRAVAVAAATGVGGWAGPDRIPIPVALQRRAAAAGPRIPGRRPSRARTSFAGCGLVDGPGRPACHREPLTSPTPAGRPGRAALRRVNEAPSESSPPPPALHRLRAAPCSPGPSGLPGGRARSAQARAGPGHPGPRAAAPLPDC
jgi:hypothetical protein